jgi:elongation factor G
MSHVASAPLLRLAISAKTPADVRVLTDALTRLRSTGPLLSVSLPDAAGRAVIEADSEPQLEQLVHRLRREYGVDAAIGKPEIAFKETFSSVSRGEGRYIRHAGGRGHYAHAKITVVPLPPGLGYYFENQITDGAIPNHYIEPLAEGIQDALERGSVGRYPIDDVRVELYSGSYHDTDSSETAFKIAGALAVQDAARPACCVVTEPVMWIEVEVPDRDVLMVTHDLAMRRADIRSREARGATNYLRARVPLRRLFGYESELRQRTNGRASCHVTLDRYEPLRGANDAGGNRPDAHVTSPLRPAPSSRRASIVLPEPD